MPNPKKLLLKLNLGDPTVSGALPVCPVAVPAVTEALNSCSYIGYGPAIGESQFLLFDNVTGGDTSSAQPIRCNGRLATENEILEIMQASKTTNSTRSGLGILPLFKQFYTSRYSPPLRKAINSCRNCCVYLGTLEAREAVARHFTHPEAPVTAESVVLTSGCSHAVKMAIEALANPGDNILVPTPCFSLYSTLIKPLNIEVCYCISKNS